MKRKSLEKDICPVARSLEAIGDTWSVLIIRQAFAGMRRFGEFQTALGVAKNILAARLQKLVKLGVLDRVPAADGSAHHDYTLTKRGQGLHLVLMAMRQWDVQCGGQTNHVLIDRRDRQPVRPLQFYAHDGRELQAEDMELVLESEV